tara:strand:+ start:255 stop:596 length:342 start_codon:yes stop_codon:yes gene_type:complete
MVWLAGCSLFSHRSCMMMPFKLVNESQAPVRFYDEGISAGFSSPAQGLTKKESYISNDLLISNDQKPHSLPKPWSLTMIGAGINDRDVIVVEHGLYNHLDKIFFTCANSNNIS